ncbi:MAG TPA: hypothetical protein VEB23_14615 [Ramlibacter sp.]|nr:hypothetical protein [Ramlibacter sp.]
MGISQPAVSDLMARGVLGRGQMAKTWLLAYTAHLREQAAGRGADGELAANRAKESATRNELLQIRLKKARGQYAEVALLEQALAAIGAQVASHLETLPSMIKTMVPELTAERLKRVEQAITEARNLAAAAALSVLEDDPTGDMMEERAAVGE